MRRPHHDQVTPFDILLTGVLGIAIGAAIGGTLALAKNSFDEERANNANRQNVRIVRPQVRAESPLANLSEMQATVARAR